MLEVTVCGIPCQVEITRARYVKPQSYSPYSCDSDMDYYGYWSVLDYEIYDRKGYRAKWLENKMKPQDHAELFRYLCETLDPEDY